MELFLKILDALANLATALGAILAFAKEYKRNGWGGRSNQAG